MQFSFSNDQIEFAAGLREMLERELTAAHLREVWDGGEGHDPGLWKRLADMGVLGMMVGEPDGGLGGGFVDTAGDLAAIGHIELDGDRAATAARDVVDELVDLGPLLANAERDVGAGLRERFGDGTAKAAGGARDERGAAGEIEGRQAGQGRSSGG